VVVRFERFVSGSAGLRLVRDPDESKTDHHPNRIAARDEAALSLTAP
jgi:hypothetical protein